MFSIDPLTPETAEAALPALVELLRDSVAAGASIGFLWPLSVADAQTYWQEVVSEALQGVRVLLLARQDGRIVGSVQLSPCPRQNGWNRAEVQKLLVHTHWRQQGIARALMAAVEQQALARNRHLLYLDTEPGKPAEQLYEKLGYTRAGVIPNYACTPDGVLHGTVLFYREL